MITRIRVPALGLLLAAASLAIDAQQPLLITAPGASPALWGILTMPVAPGPHPGVILLPGSAGWRPAYAEMARVLADSGFAALALDYYGQAGRDTSAADAAAKRPAWLATIREAVDYLRASPAVSGRPVGLVGYSRGAFLAVSVAAASRTVSAVVDFYGGGAEAIESLTERGQRFPPLLLLHGDADSAIPVGNAYRLRDAVLARGGEVEMQVYPGAGHGFNAPFAPAYSKTAAADAWARTFDFLRRRLDK